MATFADRLALLISADVDGAVRGLNKLEREADRSIGSTDARLDSMGANMTKIGAGMLSVGVLAGVGLGRAAGAASDLNEAVNVTNEIFGDARDEIDEFAENAASSIGQSERAAREALATFGGLLDNMGLSREETVKWSKDLTTLASDLGSMFNTNPEDAVLALGAALRGESEPIRRYNVMLDDASVRLRAVELGLAASTDEVDNAAKVQGRLSLIMEQTASAQGDFARTSDGMANAQRSFNAQLEDFQASLGQAVLPAIEDVLGKGVDLLGWFNDLDPEMQQTISQAALLGTGLLIVGGGVSMTAGALIKMRTNLVAAKAAMMAMSATTIAATAGIAALAVGAVFLFNKLRSGGIDMQEHADRLARIDQHAQSLKSTMNQLTGAVTQSTVEMAAAEFAALGLDEQLDAAGLTGQAFADAINAWIDPLVERGPAGGRQDEMSEFVASIADGSEKGDDLAASMLEVRRGLITAQEEIVGTERVMGDMSDTAEETTEEIEKLEEAWGDLVDELLGSSDSFISAAEFLEDIVDAGEGINDMSYAEARREIDDLAREYGETIGEMVDEGRSIEDIADFAGTARAGLFGLMVQAGLSADEAQRVIAALDAIDGRVVTATLQTRIEGTGLSTIMDERAIMRDQPRGVDLSVLEGIDWSVIVQLDGQDVGEGIARANSRIGGVLE